MTPKQSVILSWNWGAILCINSEKRGLLWCYCTVWISKHIVHRLENASVMLDFTVMSLLHKFHADRMNRFKVMVINVSAIQVAS